MKIRPVILCGGAGTRLWPNAKKHQAKQFIDFGNWTLLGKTLERVKASIFDTPIISTNSKYLKQVKKHLKRNIAPIYLEVLMIQADGFILANRLRDTIPLVVGFRLAHLGFGLDER